jgi:NAD(P)-dependent dehydrogenase (short-subunit alcohol dehydrogenase family)
MKRNAKPTALVTGAARGIGRAIAARLLAAGWNVVLADVLEKEGKQTAAGLNRLRKKNAGRAEFMACDVADEAQIAAAVKNAIEKFGRLDALVNNAGIAHPYNPPVEKLPLAEWNRKIAVNLTGPFLCAKHAAPHLRRAPGGGAIVNISSTRAFLAEPHTETYNASKAALLGLTRSLALSLGPRVRVNAICPGWIDTRPVKESAAAAKREKHAQHPVGRVGRPEDIAELALFLIETLRSGFITGQTIICDGGMRVKMIYEE